MFNVFSSINDTTYFFIKLYYNQMPDNFKHLFQSYLLSFICAKTPSFPWFEMMKSIKQRQLLQYVQCLM